MNPQPQTLSAAELLKIRETLWAAMDDIREHLQVAKYNLRGEALGEIVGKPDMPKLIHEAGITASEEVIEKLRLASCNISGHLSRKTTVGDDLITLPISLVKGMLESSQSYLLEIGDRHGYDTVRREVAREIQELELAISENVKPTTTNPIRGGVAASGSGAPRRGAHE